MNVRAKCFRLKDKKMLNVLLLLSYSFVGFFIIFLAVNCVLFSFSNSLSLSVHLIDNITILKVHKNKLQKEYAAFYIGFL